MHQHPASTRSFPTSGSTPRKCAARAPKRSHSHPATSSACCARSSIVLITGPSGAGKSTLLRELIRAAVVQRHRVIDLAHVTLPSEPIVDLFHGLSLRDTLLLLSRVGLGEAWSYLRKPSQLSDGQRWRLRLALALREAEQEPGHCVVLAADEFAALLDRVTAQSSRGPFAGRSPPAKTCSRSSRRVTMT